MNEVSRQYELPIAFSAEPLADSAHKFETPQLDSLEAIHGSATMTVPESRVSAAYADLGGGDYDEARAWRIDQARQAAHGIYSSEFNLSGKSAESPTPRPLELKAKGCEYMRDALINSGMTESQANAVVRARGLL